MFFNTAGDNPAHCELFYPCTETLNPDGSGAMVDVIRGCTYQPSTVAGQTLVNGPTAVNSIYSVAPSGVIVTTAKPGITAMPDFSTRNVIGFGCGMIVDNTTLRLPFGNGDAGTDNMGLNTNTGGNIALSFNGNPHCIVNTSNAQVVSSPIGSMDARVPPPNGTEVAVILEWTNEANNGWLRCKVIGLDGNTFGAGGTETIYERYATGVLPVAINPGLNNKVRYGGMAWYGIAAFSFPGALPSNRTEVYLQMFNDWKAGRRVLPKQWSYSTP